MIFLRVSIKNLFSYREEEFDFSGAESDRNIVLIYGRNNFGKTNFINSIKLLFVGANEEMCSSALAGSNLRQKQYILGAGEDWMGIINRQAIANLQEPFGQVKILWKEKDMEVEACRRWDVLKNNKYNESVTVNVNGEKSFYYESDDAQAFLNERLPEDYLSFFFFDGEQIQHLAEANRKRQQKHIEKLLNISKIDSLVSALDSVIKDWRKEAMPEEERLKLTNLENSKKTKEGEISVKNEEIFRLRKEHEELEQKIQEDKRYLESRRNAGQQESQLKEKQKKLKDEIEKEEYQLAEGLPVIAPMLVNPALVSSSIEELKNITTDNSLFGTFCSIFRELSVDLFDKPPFPNKKLDETQKSFLKEKLDELLKKHVYLQNTNKKSLFILEHSYKASDILQALNIYHDSHSASMMRQEYQNKLGKISSLKREMRQIKELLDNTTHLSPEEQTEYDKCHSRYEENLVRKGQIEEQIKSISKSLEKLDSELSEKDSEIRAQEKKVRLSARNRLELDKAEEVKKFFVEYKTRLKSNKREKVQEVLNEKLKELVSSNALIKFVRVDEHFGLHFFGVNDDTIGMANLSAGMKQLTATALLWALKEVSAKDMPLIIDTPLARIDRLHQENLLKKYYPHVGKQVIILPTDSEIDRDKYAILKPYIYKQYCLETSNGNNTKVVEKNIYY